MKNALSKIICLAIALMLVLPALASAAQLSMQVPQQLGVGDEFIVPVVFNTQGADINALQASISYPNDVLALKEIRSGDSIIPLLVDTPHESSGIIEFSG